MDVMKTILVLVVIVAVVFLARPELLGAGDDTPLLNVVSPSPEQISVETDESCTTTQDCQAYAESLGASIEVPTACVDNKCVFYAEKTLDTRETP